MEFDNAFEVPLPPAEAWPVLMDIRGIAPCMPGAQLTDVIDDKNYKGNISVRLGPVALTFAGVVTFEEIDNVNHTARVRAQGTDAKGRGSAQAKATFKLEPSATGSKVMVHTDLTLSGAVAQYGRGVGMIQATASALMNQFAAALKKKIAQQPAPQAAVAPQQRSEAPPAPAAASAAAPASAAPASAAPPPAASATPRAAPLPPAAKPISGFTLMVQVLWNSIRGLFGGQRRG
jgi:carbon monoxide dehydrogenase subunit G